MAFTFAQSTECIDELTDELTGLPTGVIQRVHLRFALDRAQRAGSQVGLVLLDVDDFVAIDEQWGWGLGGLVLRQVADRLRATVRHDDVVVRLDGDLFVIACEDLVRTADMAAIVRRLDGALSEPWVVCGHVIDLHISVGTAMSPGTGSPGELLIAAETDLARVRLLEAAGSVSD